MLQIQYFDLLPEEIGRFVQTEQDAYEAAKQAVCAYTPFHFAATEGAPPETVGVVSGYTCWREVYIDELVVRADARNRGIGRALLQAVERRFSGKGYHYIDLVTSAFQAPEFYRKCGYQLEFLRKNAADPKLDKYFFIKWFPGAAPRQAGEPALIAKKEGLL